MTEHSVRLSAEEHSQLRLALGHTSSACLDWPCVTCANTITAVEAIIAARREPRHVEVSLDIALVRAFDLADDWEAIAQQIEIQNDSIAAQLRSCAHDLRVRLTGSDLIP